MKRPWQVSAILKKADFPVIHVINSLGWKRSGIVKLFVDFQVLPINRPVKIIDLSTGLEVLAQMIHKRAEGAIGKWRSKIFQLWEIKH